MPTSRAGASSLPAAQALRQPCGPRPVPFRRQMPFESAEDRRPALPVDRLQALQVAVVVPGVQELGDRRLGERTRMEIRVALEEGQALDDRGRSGDVAEPESREETLRKAAEVHD